MSIIFYNVCMIGLVVGVARGSEWYIYVIYRVFNFYYKN